MKLAKLEVLGIEFPLTKYQEYKDEGFVRSTLERVEELYALYGCDRHWLLDICQELDQEFPKGVTVTFGPKGIWPFRKTHVYVFYEDMESDIKNIRVRAHEETHVLDRFGRLKALEKRIEEEGLKLKSRLKKLSSEQRANIGSFYALLKQDFSVQEIKREDIPWHALADLDLIYKV